MARLQVEIVMARLQVEIVMARLQVATLKTRQQVATVAAGRNVLKFYLPLSAAYRQLKIGLFLPFDCGKGRNVLRCTHVTTKKILPLHVTKRCR
jgi:hypothetical protein